MLQRLCVYLLAVACAPAVAAPCAGFNDVDDSSAFCANVEWIKNRGITLGCAADLFCPNDSVSRLQMAAFLNRLGNVTFQQGGNSFGATAVFGTNDSFPVELRVNGVRVGSLKSGFTAPNVVLGYSGNTASVTGNALTIGGGGLPGSDCFDHLTLMNDRSCANHVRDGGSTIGGGASNQASSGGTIAGGYGNNAGESAFVGGGQWNSATAANSTVSGGQNNRATEFYATVAGGTDSSATAIYAAVGGGRGNVASNYAATAAGGEWNESGGTSATVSGGFMNKAFGAGASIPGGELNIATGPYSFAAGRRANANARGCFAWGDDNDFDFPCNVNNQFIARTTGGVTFVTAINAAGLPIAGVAVGAGGNAWMQLSDREVKTDVTLVDSGEILRGVIELPITSWSYRTESGIRHVGPMAQDFHAAFGLGSSDRHIVTIDADGVALAAIQGLNAKLEQQLTERDALIAAQRSELLLQREQLEALRRIVDTLVQRAR